MMNLRNLSVFWTDYASGVLLGNHGTVVEYIKVM